MACKLPGTNTIGDHASDRALHEIPASKTPILTRPTKNVQLKVLKTTPYGVHNVSFRPWARRRWSNTGAKKSRHCSSRALGPKSHRVDAAVDPRFCGRIGRMCDRVRIFMCIISGLVSLTSNPQHLRYPPNNAKTKEAFPSC